MSKSPIKTPVRPGKPGTKGPGGKKDENAYITLAEIPSAAAIANEEEKVLILESFKHFDSIGDGRINFEMLVIMLRRCGLNPTKEQMLRFKADFDPENIGFIGVDDAFKCYALAWKMPSKLEEGYVSAFQVFDKEGQGLVNSTEFKEYMANYGEKFMPDSVTLMTKDSEPDPTGMIHYRDFIQKMLMSNEPKKKKGKAGKKGKKGKKGAKK